MSYLSLLQGLRNQPSNFDAFVQSVNDAGQSFARGLADDREQRRKLAQEQAALIQKQAGAMLQAGQGKQAAELLPKFREAVKTGWNYDTPNTSVVGAPVMGQVPNPDFIGPMPLGQQAMKRGEVGRDFSGDQTLNAIRGGLMLEPPKAPERDLFKASPYENVIDTRTGKVIIPAQSKPAPEAAPRMGWVGDVYQELKPGLTRPAREAAPRPERDTSAAMRQWQTGRVRFIEDFVKSRAAQLPMTMVMQDPTSTKTHRLDKPIRETPTQAQIETWRKEAAAYYDTNVTRPFEQPGSGQAAPAVRGIRSSAILPPKDYNDTALMPEWEKLAQQAVALAPGAAISSKARSKERNVNAGGVAGSWHEYRQAFDLAGVKPADKPKLIQWGRQLGLEVIDEGDHLHFEPARSSDAMRNFYAKHGLESDDA